MVETIDSALRDNNTLGDPGSGDYKVKKGPLRTVLKRIEASAGIGAVAVATKAELDAITDKADKAPGFVVGDSTASNNGQYTWDDSGSAWVKVRDLPDTATILESVAGTNDVTANVATGVNPAAVSLFVLTPANTNTGTMTLAIEGETAQDFKTYAGDDFASGAIVAGRAYLIFDTGSEYRALNDDRILPFQGAYAGGTTYSLGDLVENGGSIWYSLQDSNTGNTPSEGAYWTEFLPGVTVADNSVTSAKLANDVRVTALAKFNSVALLIADTIKIGYSGADITIVSGDIVEAQGFRYEVAASGASDHDLITAGGVKLYVLPEDGYLNLKAFNADPEGATSAAAILNAVIEKAAGNFTVWISDGDFLIDDEITLHPLSKIDGDQTGRLFVPEGEMHNSYLFNHTGDPGDPSDGISIKHLVLDALANYPDDDTVGRQSLSYYNGAIKLVNVNNAVVEANIIKGFTLNGVYIDGVGDNNTTRNNQFDRAAYNGKVIAYYCSGVFTHKNAVIVGNYSKRNGPQIWADASNETYCSSTDGIQVDDIDGATIYGNTILECSGVAIRVEGVKRFKVFGNTVDEIGQEGITAYNSSHDGVIFGNVIRNWGKAFRSASLVDYLGTIFVCRETPHATLNPLPVAPGSVAWFEVCPYSLEGISNIRSYDSSDYSLLPFRGFGAINVSQSSYATVVRDNVIEGDLSLDGTGAYYYASDFGFSVAHNVNNPVGDGGLRCKFVDNVIRDCRVTDVYWPDFMDPAAERGETAIPPYGGKDRLVTLVPDSGSVTLNATYDTLREIRRDGMAFISGSLRVSSISSPTGGLKITGIKSRLANRTDGSEIPTLSIRAQNVGPVPGTYYGIMSAGSADITLSRYDDDAGTVRDVSGDLLSNSIFNISGWFETDD